MSNSDARHGVLRFQNASKYAVSNRSFIQSSSLIQFLTRSPLTTIVLGPDYFLEDAELKIVQGEKILLTQLRWGLERACDNESVFRTFLHSLYDNADDLI